nr:restriction endonuclease subunit S [Brevibacterium aurantiacum]
MRDGWRKITIGELCTLTKGTTPTQKAIPGQYPLVVTAADSLSSDTYQFDGEAVCIPLVSSTGHGHASLKRVHYASGKFAVANIITALEARNGMDVEMKFLWLLLDHGRDEIIVPLMKGTANVSVSQAALASAHVILPPLDEQRRIVDLIESVDDVIDRALRYTMECNAVSQARRKDLMKATDYVRMDSVATMASGAAFPSSEQGMSVGSIPFVKVSDMNLPGNETHIRRANNYVSREAAARLGAKLWPSGTVIFPKVGAALSTEKRRVLTEVTAIDNNVMGLVPIEGVSLTGFLFAFMRTVKLGLYAQPGAVPSINQKHVRSIRAPRLSIEEQSAIIDEAECLDAVMQSSEFQLDRLRNLRANLLTTLLSGEHEIPAAYDALVEETAA